MATTLDRLVFDLVIASDPDLSAQGRSLVYKATSARRGTRTRPAELRLHDLSSGEETTIATDVVCPGRWSPDGTRIALGVRDSTGRSTLRLLDKDGTFLSDVDSHAQELSAVAWAPDGTRVAFSTQPRVIDNTEDHDPIEINDLGYKEDGYGFLGDQGRAWVFDLARQEAEPLDLPEDRSFTSPAWSPDGHHLAFTSASRRDGRAYVAVSPISPNHLEGVILIGPDEGIASFWAWSPDSRAILLWAAPRGTCYPETFIYDLETRRLRSIASDSPTLPTSPPLWIEGHQAVFAGVAAGKSGLYTLDTRTGHIDRRFEWQETRTHLAASRDGRVLAQDTQSFSSVGEVIVYDADTGAAISTTNHNVHVLAGLRVGWERLQVAGTPDVEGWLLTPPDFSAEKQYPTILLIHGGPEGSFGHMFSLTAQGLASQGFLVLCANPRGSLGYGRAFADGVLLDWGEGPLEDVLRLLNVVTARPYADSKRVGIMGASYGGYLSAYAIAHTDRFSAAACVAVTFDLTSQYLGGDMDFHYGDIAWGGAPQLNPEWYSMNSPSSSANRVRTPTLILHGLADHRCPLGQAEEMFVALKKFGVPTQLVLYPGASHDLEEADNPEHVHDYLQRIIHWFSQHL
jgi:dipeptidyl aminopeptidase/acylaminoacyl peptidase